MNVLGLFQSQEINPTGMLRVVAVDVNNEKYNRNGNSDIDWLTSAIYDKRYHDFD